jgi:hypothetical protein
MRSLGEGYRWDRGYSEESSAFHGGPKRGLGGTGPIPLSCRYPLYLRSVPP